MVCLLAAAWRPANSVLKEKGTLQMALRPAVELSYLSKDEQNALLEVMEGEDCTPSRCKLHRSIALSRLRYISKAFTMVSSIFCNLAKAMNKSENISV